MNCRRCSKPDALHCPDCDTCWPDHTCSLYCEADPDEIGEVLAAIENWEEAHAR